MICWSDSSRHKAVATTQAKASTPNSKMESYCCEALLLETRNDKRGNKATKNRMKDARRAMQLSYGGRTARAESYSTH